MQNKKAAVFILLGQSNAVGHGIRMRKEDIIREPLKNVFGLNRENNQSFDNTALTWSGYTSFGMNLAEQQDNTYSVANCLAALWQKHIDDGNEYDLPNLYIIHIAIGAQGVTEQFMWYPEYEKQLIPGKLSTVNISLFPFSEHIFSLLDDSFVQIGTDYEIIGLHWLGGESDATITKDYLSEHLEAIYRHIFDEFNHLLSNPPTILYKILCSDRMNSMDPTGQFLDNMHYINDVFNLLEEKYDNITVFDMSNFPQYIPNVPGNGLFMKDLIHYTKEVNSWVAEGILNKYASDKT